MSYYTIPFSLETEEFLFCEMTDHVGVSVVEHCQVVEAIADHIVRAQEK